MKKVISLWLFLYIPKIPQCKKASSGSFFRIYVSNAAVCEDCFTLSRTPNDAPPTQSADMDVDS